MYISMKYRKKENFHKHSFLFANDRQHHKKHINEI